MNELKQIKLLAAWEDFESGTILRVDEKTAEELLTAKTAEVYDPEAEKRAAEAEAELAKRIVSQVKSELTKPEPAPDVKAAEPRVEVKERIEDDPKLGWKSIGEFGAAVKDAAIGKGVDKRLLTKATGLSEGVSSDGGFLVPEEFASELLRRVYDRGLVYSRARQFAMSSLTLKIPTISESSRVDGSRQGGVRGYWTAEAAAKTPSDPAFGQIELNLHKLVVLTYATDELLQDAVGLNSLLGDLAAEELAFKLDDACINGTGAGQPLGILNAPALVTVGKESGQAAATIVANNIVNMWSRMYSRSRGTSVWFVNQNTLPQLHTMSIAVGTGGLPVYMPANGLAGQAYGTLYGRPVIEVEQCSTLGTVGDVILADMSQYVFAQHSSGVQSATSIHLKFNYDETAFRWVLRADGQPWWASALTPYKGSTTVSPFVALATRS